MKLSYDFEVICDSCQKTSMVHFRIWRYILKALAVVFILPLMIWLIYAIFFGGKAQKYPHCGKRQLIILDKQGYADYLRNLAKFEFLVKLSFAVIAILIILIVVAFASF